MARAYILLKSSHEVAVEKLQTINTESHSDFKVSSIESFDEFHLRPNEKLSFVGEKKIVTLLSDLIEYVSIERD